jgi:glucosamine kinase
VTVDGDARSFVIAADSGGTHTRVACFGLDGGLLAEADGPGGARFHNADAAANTAETTARCLAASGLDARDALQLVAGLSNISRPGSNQGDGDNSWASAFFAVPGLDCPREIVNDAVTAHRGALLGEPGIVAIAGTGSMILAIDDEGVEVESGQFEHYAGAARHLVFEAMQLILTGAAAEDDRPLVSTVLEFWGAADIAGLRAAVLALGAEDPRLVRHRYGRLAPAITAAADTSPLADQAIRSLAGKTARGIRLLAPLIERDRVPVALYGSLAETTAFRSRVADALAEAPGTNATLVPTELDAVRGAALIAYRRLGVEVTAAVIERLRASSVAQPSG